MIRHCEAMGPAPNAPLTESGRQQAQHLAEFLADYPVDFIATSQFARTKQTIAPFAATVHLPINTDNRLNERTLSASPVANWQEVVRDSFGDDLLRLPGGESASDVLQRAWSALRDLFELKYSMPVVVTHGNLMALVLHSIDSSFGFDGWKSLTNPDLYVLQENGAGRHTFERIGAN